ncbi:MAG TPA: BamA/TamA family outer membrane protein [Chitinophagales bacterium]|nr:BamA/TamA family outer membrane protein [Chitinophagales bacterium]
MRSLLTAVFVFMLGNLIAQNRYTVQITASDQPPTFFTKKFGYNVHAKDSVQARRDALTLLQKIRSFGYAGASIDSIKGDSLHTYIYMYIGDRFESMALSNGNVDERLLGDAGVKNAVLSGKPVPVSVALQVKERLLQQCENSGYPFATVRLDSFTRQGSSLAAKVFLDKRELIRYDTLRILGKTRTKNVFLRNYLGIKTSKPYDEANVKRINQRLADLQFVEIIQPRDVEFLNSKAKVNVFLKDKKASQFDFLLGFLPGSSGQKLLITGDAHLHLYSMFGMGEEFSLQWQKLQPKTQTLNAKIVYPYLIGLPLGVNVTFDLYKRDTTYVDINGDYGIQYQLAGSNYLKASLKQKITIVTNVDTNYIIANHTLPQNLDISSNDFALEFFLQKLDYKFNPTSGFDLTIGASAGVRVIKKNNNITQLFDELNGRYFSYLYDTVRLKVFEFSAGLNIEKYWRLAPRHTIKTAIDGKYHYAPQIYQNEEYRLGGINSLRGFDDQSIFTPYYLMGDFEYRFLLSKNSYISAFFNAAMVKNAPDRNGTFDYPFGFGVSGAIETKAGIFGISYAMGRQLGNPVTFKSGKIHFGYINYF